MFGVLLLLSGGSLVYGAGLSESSRRDKIAQYLSAKKLDFLRSGNEKELDRLIKNDIHAPFFIALRGESQDINAETLSRLYAITWKGAKEPLRQEAGRRFLMAEIAKINSASRATDRQFFLDNVRLFQDRYRDDPDTRGLVAQCYLSLGEYRALALLFPSLQPAKTEQERAAVLLAAMRTGDSTGPALASDFFLDAPADFRYESVAAECKNYALPRLPEAAIQARLFVWKKAYSDGLYYFKQVLAEKGSGFFLDHPETLADLGKAYQFSGTSAAKEGARLFEKLAARPTSAASRYRAFFYAGRMYRQLNQLEKAKEMFTASLPFAADGEQLDASLWYLFTTQGTLDVAAVPALLHEFVPRLSNAAYFEDFFQSYCTRLVTLGKWAQLLESFHYVRALPLEQLVARYAYILGRAFSLGYLPTTESAATVAASFFRLAFDADQMYYHFLSSACLGEQNRPVIDEARSKKRPKTGTEELQFLRLFFTFGTSDLAYSFAVKYQAALTADNITQLSLAFTQAGLYAEAVRTAFMLVRRDDHALTREDLELVYPRFYGQEIAESALQWGVPLYRMFALVRTESLFNKEAISSARAVGLAQLMRPTADEVAWRINKKAELNYVDGELDLKDPQTNLHLGAFYLAHLEDRLTSPLLALFAYNGGIGRVKRWRSECADLPEDLFLETIPLTETQEYGRKLLTAEAIYSFLYADKSVESVVRDYFPVLTGRY